ncbi:MAG TPA: hypothetical protein EYP61_00615, partial [Candidatus Latescibacteria bacterium]|nr:hypothetical protein [Candidatus Latescibacterota bacterium]
MGSPYTNSSAWRVRYLLPRPSRSGYPPRTRFRVLKVKVGAGGEEEVLSAVREVWDGPVRVDANGAWSPEEAISKIKTLEKFDIELVEQPVPPGDPDTLAAVRDHASVPVFAD